MATTILAVVLGIGFGFSLNKAGLTKYHKIVNVFRFTDMAVLKFMMTALVVAMAVCAGAGVLIERLLYTPLLHLPRIVPLIASIGLFIAMEVLTLAAALLLCSLGLKAQEDEASVAGKGAACQNPAGRVSDFTRVRAMSA